METKILIIDDEKMMMSMYVKYLEKAHFDVKQCFDPDEVFMRLADSNERPDLIVLDIMMRPGEIYRNRNTYEGLETGVLMLKDLTDKLPDVPVVVLTNVANEETLEKIDAHRKVKIAQKLNMTPGDLVELVKKELSNRSIRRA